MRWFDIDACVCAGGCWIRGVALAVVGMMLAGFSLWGADGAGVPVAPGRAGLAGYEGMQSAEQVRDMGECLVGVQPLQGSIDPNARFYMFLYFLVMQPDLEQGPLGKPADTFATGVAQYYARQQKKLKQAGVQVIVCGPSGDVMKERLVRFCRLNGLEFAVLDMERAKGLPGFEWGLVFPYVALVDRQGRQLACSDGKCELDWQRVIQGKERKKRRSVAYVVAQMPLLAGQPMKRAQYYLYLNWNVCAYARDQVLEMVMMYPEMRKAGVEMIVCFWDENKSAPAAFLRENGIDVPAVMSDDAKNLPGFWLRRGPHAAVLVDARGRVIHKVEQPYLPDWKRVISEWEREHPGADKGSDIRPKRPLSR